MKVVSQLIKFFTENGTLTEADLEFLKAHGFMDEPVVRQPQFDWGWDDDNYYYDESTDANLDWWNHYDELMRILDHPQIDETDEFMLNEFWHPVRGEDDLKMTRKTGKYPKQHQRKRQITKLRHARRQWQLSR